MNKLTILPLILIMYSCALKPISSEYNFVKINKSDVSFDNLGSGKVLIYNNTNILFKIDNTARINVLINDKPLGQLRPKEFVILDFNLGNHIFKLKHLDLVNMKSIHEVEIKEDTKVIRIQPTLTANKLTITNEMPEKFDKFEFMPQR